MPRTTHGLDLDWLLESLIQRIPRTRCAVLLSSDGLVKAAHGTETDTADTLAAAASAIYALARGLASAIGDQGGVRQVVAEVGEHVVLVATGGDGTRLLVAAERDVDSPSSATRWPPSPEASAPPWRPPPGSPEPLWLRALRLGGRHAPGHREPAPAGMTPLRPFWRNHVITTAESAPAGVPFGVRELRPAHVVHIDPSQFTYDNDRQLNVMADGQLWANTAMAASSTATNNDSTSGADETADPYAFPGDASVA